MSPYGKGKRPGYIDLSKPRHESDSATALGLALIAAIAWLVILATICAVIWL